MCARRTRTPRSSRSTLGRGIGAGRAGGVHRRRSRRFEPDAGHPTQPAAGDEPTVPRRRARALRRRTGRRRRRRDAGAAIDAAELRARRIRAAAGRDRPRRVGCGRGADLPRRRHEHRAELATPAQADFGAVRGRRQRADREPAPQRSADGAPGRRRLLDAGGPARALLVVPGRARHKAMLSAVYGLEPHDVRVRSCPTSAAVSGSSRARTRRKRCSASTPARSGRPVRWIETRTENMLSMPQGRGQDPARDDRRHAATAGSRPTSSTSCRTPVPTRCTGSVLHTMTMRMTCGVYDIDERRVHRRLDGDERTVDHRLSRCRAARGGGGDRAHGRPVRSRDRHRPGRGAAAQRDSRPSSMHAPPASARPTTSATTAVRWSSRWPPPATTTCVPSRRRGGRQVTMCSSASVSRPTSRSPPASAVRSTARSSSSPTGGTARPHGHHALRAGPRDDVGDDRLRSHGRADRADHASSTATPTRSAAAG